MMREFIKKIADFFNKYWIAKILVLFFPTIWTPVILKIWGVNLGLSDINSVLTLKGKVYTVLVFLAALFVNIVSSYKSGREKEREQQLQAEIATLKVNLNVYQTVMDSIYDICDSKYDTLLDYMDNIEKTKKCEKPFISTVQPTKQLKAISDKLAKCFSEITSIRKNDLIVSMAYSVAGENSKWKWVDFKKLHGCATLEQLLENQRSAFYRVLSGEEEFVFYNNKIEAEKCGKYVSDQKDKSHKNVGSIVCQRIEVGSQDQIQGSLILSISSYGQMFVKNEENIENVKETIRDVILKQFEKRICIELSDLFIQEYYCRYKANKGPIVNGAVFNSAN